MSPRKLEAVYEYHRGSRSDVDEPEDIVVLARRSISRSSSRFRRCWCGVAETE